MNGKIPLMQEANTKLSKNMDPAKVERPAEHQFYAFGVRCQQCPPVFVFSRPRRAARVCFGVFFAVGFIPMPLATAMLRHPGLKGRIQ